MFNTIRPIQAPDCLNFEKYNTHEVVNILEPMFFGKCYLCEQDELSDPEIEHLDPHEGDASKKYDWNNLYYSCGRCNSIKSNTYKNLLDCCDQNIDIFRRIKCTLPSTPDDVVGIIAMEALDCEKTNNTVKLLTECYNADNTALRGITRSVLIEKLFDHYADYLSYRAVLRNKRSTEHEITHAKGRIKSMLQVKFPFSVFWRWHLLNDSLLKTQLIDLVDF